MKPSKKCKAAGLTGLAELVEISKFKYRALLYCAKNNPDKFDFIVRAAGAEKAKQCSVLPIAALMFARLLTWLHKSAQPKRTRKARK